MKKILLLALLIPQNIFVMKVAIVEEKPQQPPTLLTCLFPHRYQRVITESTLSLKSYGKYNAQPADPPASTIRQTTELNLRKTGLVALPVNLGIFAALQHLDLSGNKLTHLSGIGNLTALRHLNLSNNPLCALPTDIGSLTNLETLLMKSTKTIESWAYRQYKAPSIPKEIGQCVALTHLDISNSALSTLREEVGALPALTHLDVSGNCLEGLPSTIGGCSSLTHLDASNNRLKTVPPSIGQLVALVSLHLANNQLSSIPYELGNCKALDQLDLTNNRITSLPSELANCTSLACLDATDNKIRNLGKGILALPGRGTQLVCRRNPLSNDEVVALSEWKKEHPRQADNLVLVKLSDAFILARRGLNNDLNHWLDG